jgi:hypothetical protein
VTVVAALACCGGIASAAAACAGGFSVSAFQIMVLRPGARAAVPLREAHAIVPGSKILYTPLRSLAQSGKQAMVSMVLSPAANSGVDPSEVMVLEPKSALLPAEWETSVTVDVAAVVYGPQGLDRSKVKKLVKADADLIPQLADYAEKTALTENLLQQLQASSANAATPSSIEAAMRGLSATPGGTAVARTAPLDQQATALIRGLNPAIATYDPLAPSTSTRVAQSAGLAASVAGLFFGNTVGLATGSAALAINLRSLMFPNTDFRSSFMQPTTTADVTLCARREVQPSRTRLAYLWAVRVPNTPAPSFALPAGAVMPRNGVGAFAVKPPAETSWASIAAVKQWSLLPTGVEIPVEADAVKHELRIDLTKASISSGIYHLQGMWDGSPFPVEGTLEVVPQPDLSHVVVDPKTSQWLIQGGNPAKPLELSGADFRFITEARIAPVAATGIEFVVPLTHTAQGLQAAVPSTELKAGDHHLILLDRARRRYPVAVRVLPPLPEIEGQPLRANREEPGQVLTLQGKGLDRITALTAPGATITLGAAAPTQRTLTVKLDPALPAGQTLKLAMQVEGMIDSAPVPAALRIAPARPRILSATASREANPAIEQLPNELSADAVVTYSLRVANAGTQAALRLACADRDKTLSAQQLRPGMKTQAARLEQSGDASLFLSLQPGAIGQPGCELQATLENPEAGPSDPRLLGRVIRLPRIDRFSLTEEKLDNGNYVGQLEGERLDAITHVGWEPANPTPVDALPAPQPADPQRQTLRIALPWPSPSPKAPLYVWLPGEPKARRTTVRYQ